MRLSNDTDKVDLIKPSRENTFNVAVSIEIVEFISVIKLEKHICLLNKSSPSDLIARVIFEFINKSCSIIKYEKFIHKPKNISLKRNWYGDSIWEKDRWDIKYLTEK